MVRTRFLLVVALFVLAACGTCLPQGLNRPHPVRLLVIVSYQGGQAKASYATVELMDAVGGSSALDKQLTDQNGRVEVNTITGAHRIRITGDDILAYNGLGSFCWQLRDIPAARQAFLKATELNDKFAGAHRNLARILLSDHNYQEAASLLNRSLDVEPMDAWALTNAAYAELQLHRFKEAAAHALRVHGLPHDGLANAHVIAGYALEALGQQQEAAEQWRFYLKEDTKGPRAKRAQEAVSRLTKIPIS